MKNLQTTLCECGYQFSHSDIKPPLIKVPQGFHGGNVQRFSEAECPQCGKAYSLWLKRIPNSWAVSTIAPRGWDPDAQDGEADQFDVLEKDELKEWLDTREVEYTKNWGEKRLRETARAWVAAQSKGDAE